MDDREMAGRLDTIQQGIETVLIAVQQLEQMINSMKTTEQVTRPKDSTVAPKPSKDQAQSTPIFNMKKRD